MTLSQAIENWLDRLPLTLAIIAVMIGSLFAVFAIGVLADGLMWSVYFLGWEDIPPNVQTFGPAR